MNSEWTTIGYERRVPRGLMFVSPHNGQWVWSISLVSRDVDFADKHRGIEATAEWAMAAAEKALPAAMMEAGL